MTHTFPVTVYYEDTDMGGVVYHANYLKFIERARSDWVRQMGVDQLELRAAGTAFAVRRLNADFLSPARLDDRLTVETVPQESTGARAMLSQTVRFGDRDLFRACVEIVAFDMATGAPRRLPAELRRKSGAQ